MVPPVMHNVLRGIIAVLEFVVITIVQEFVEAVISTGARSGQIRRGICGRWTTSSLTGRGRGAFSFFAIPLTKTGFASPSPTVDHV